MASPSMGRFTRPYAKIEESRYDHTSLAFSGPIPLPAGPPPLCTTVTGQSPGQDAGGEPCGGPQRPGDAPTLIMEPGSPISDVSLQYIHFRYLKDLFHSDTSVNLCLNEKGFLTV
jgi:hypothetical protein